MAWQVGQPALWRGQRVRVYYVIPGRDSVWVIDAHGVLHDAPGSELEPTAEAR